MEGKSGACRKRAVERQSKQIENQPFCELQDGLDFLRNRCQLVSRILALRKKWHFSVLVFASHSFIIYTLFENDYGTNNHKGPGTLLGRAPGGNHFGAGTLRTEGSESSQGISCQNPHCSCEQKLRRPAYS